MRIKSDKRYQVIKAYNSDYTVIWRMVKGEKLTIGDRDSEWDGWVWCTNSEGVSRWVPEGFVARHGDTCIALREYESTELSVHIGEILDVGEIESGWAWCIKGAELAEQADQAGQAGWVPLECLEEI